MNSTVTVSPRKLALLRWEVDNLQQYLDEFEYPSNGEWRRAQLGSTGEYLTVRNFPLPDSYNPDYIDLLVLIDSFPAVPPIGIYVLNKHNSSLVSQLKNRFNAFRDRAFHDAPAISGYTWICTHYAGNSWRYRSDDPGRGDNIRKFLVNFFAELIR